MYTHAHTHVHVYAELMQADGYNFQTEFQTITLVNDFQIT